MKIFDKIQGMIGKKPGDELESDQIINLILKGAPSGKTLDILDSVKKNVSEPQFLIGFYTIESAADFINSISFYPRKGMVAFTLAKVTMKNGTEGCMAIVGGKLSEDECQCIYNISKKMGHADSLIIGWKPPV